MFVDEDLRQISTQFYPEMLCSVITPELVICIAADKISAAVFADIICSGFVMQSFYAIIFAHELKQLPCLIITQALVWHPDKAYF